MIDDAELSESSRTRPQITVDAIDIGPADLAPQLPARAELVRPIPGPDGQTYTLAVMHQPLAYRTTTAQLAAANVDVTAADPGLIRIHPDGTVDLRVFGVVFAPRLVGGQIGSGVGMQRFPVTMAYVVDNTVMRDAELVFAKCVYAAVAFLSHVPSRAYPAADAG